MGVQESYPIYYSIDHHLGTPDDQIQIPKELVGKLTTDQYKEILTAIQENETSVTNTGYFGFLQGLMAGSLATCFLKEPLFGPVGVVLCLGCAGIGSFIVYSNKWLEIRNREIKDINSSKTFLRENGLKLGENGDLGFYLKIRSE